MARIRASIIGVRGYTGRELLTLLLRHPQVTVTGLYGRVEQPVPIAAEFPVFAGRTTLEVRPLDGAAEGRNTDVVFLALPHTQSMRVVPGLVQAGCRVVDLGADFRLQDPEAFARWYGVPHADPAALGEAVYGLTELNRERLREARLVANPGCYPTGVILAVAPLAREGLLHEDEAVIVDAKSGVSGAGRTPNPGLHYPEINENVRAYKVNAHQHQPEMDQELSKLAGRPVSVTFTPHLVPLTRGILSTLYVRLRRSLSTEELVGCLQRAYRGEPFVRVSRPGGFPEIADVAGTNACDLGAQVDGTRAIVISALDNLLKGAAGQAVQNMNVMFGLDETQGLR